LPIWPIVKRGSILNWWIGSIFIRAALYPPAWPAIEFQMS
jgi:hypothetical protein